MPVDYLGLREIDGPALLYKDTVARWIRRNLGDIDMPHDNQEAELTRRSVIQSPTSMAGDGAKPSIDALTKRAYLLRQLGWAVEDGDKELEAHLRERLKALGVDPESLSLFMVKGKPVEGLIDISITPHFETDTIETFDGQRQTVARHKPRLDLVASVAGSVEALGMAFAGNMPVDVSIFDQETGMRYDMTVYVTKAQEHKDATGKNPVAVWKYEMRVAGEFYKTQLEF